MAFGEHLRADEHIKFTRPESHNSAFKFFAPRRCVAVKASDANIRKAFLQQGFQLFSAFADVVQEFAVTSRASVWRARPVVAIMANQKMRAAVVSERHIAFGATDGLAARTAQDERRKAAPVQ